MVVVTGSCVCPLLQTGEGIGELPHSESTAQYSSWP